MPIQNPIHFDKSGMLMGGPGSTRWGYYEKMELIENCHAISVFELNRLGFLRTNTRDMGQLVWQDDYSGRIAGSVGLVLDTLSDVPALRIIYDISLRDRYLGSIDSAVRLESTACFFGGHRWWLRCPFVRNDQVCDRRVAKLYLPPGEHYFGCSKCHSLSYKDRQEKNQYYERPQFDMQLIGKRV